METRMTQITKQSILGHEVPILGTKEDPLFRAKDVCEWLGDTNPHQTLSRIPDELRPSCVRKIKCMNGATTAWVNYLTETGVYYILMRSRSKEAIKYQMKICEILKSIRLKGYAVSNTITEEQVAKLVTDAKNNVKLIEAQGNVIRTDDRLIDAMEKLIDLYRNERAKITEINTEDLFNK